MRDDGEVARPAQPAAPARADRGERPGLRFWLVISALAVGVLALAGVVGAIVLRLLSDAATGEVLKRVL